MIRLRGTLLPENILLNMTAPSREDAVQQLTQSLRSDARITDWHEFLGLIRKCEASGKVNLQFHLTLLHIRTSTLTNMVMAFGRLAEPLLGEEGIVQFLVLVGIPRTMDAEYLRLLGTLMRVFRDEKLRHKLLYAHKPADVIKIFEKGEVEVPD